MVTQHLFMDTVKILWPALDLAAHVHSVKVLLDLAHSRMDHLLALAAFDLDLFYQVIIDLRLHITKGQVLQLPFDGIDTQTVSQRCIDLHRLARNRLLLMHRHKLHRPHIMQPVGQFYHNYAYILSHRQKHLTVVLYLLFFLRNILYLAKLRYAVHQVGHLLAKHLRQLLKADISIFHHIVQKSCRQSQFVQLELR